MSDVGQDFENDHDLAAAVQSAMDFQDAPEVEETPQAPDQTQEIQPQAAPETEQTTDGVNASEVAPAPVVETPASVAAEAPKPLLATPDVAPKQDIAPSAPTEADAARNQTLERVNNLVQQLEASANSKFADLKSEADVLALMQNNPSRYNEYVIAQTQFHRAKAAQQQVQQEAARAYVTAEQQRLQKAIPDLADPEKGEALKAELRAYAKSQGIPDTRQARNADEVIRLHREMTLAKELATLKAEKAAQAALVAKATEKAAVAPKVQAPGVQRDVNKNEKLETDFERFSKSGESDDLAQFLTHIL